MLLNILVVLCCIKVTVLAQTPMLDLRKKVQNSKVQRTQTYVRAVDEALAKNDIPAAEKALAAAIAQGTLTQNQINETRAAIQSRSSAISAQRLAQEQAKREQEQAVATSKQPAPPRPTGVAPPPGKFHSVIIAFRTTGPWYNTARVFNVDSSGRETGNPSPNSPGASNNNLKLASNDNTVSHDGLVSCNTTAGTYGYEVIFKNVDKDPLGVFGGTKVRWTSAPIRGTFTTPQGCYQVKMSWSAGGKKFDVFTHK